MTSQDSRTVAGATDPRNANVLSITDLQVHFPVRSGLRTVHQLRAVDGVSLKIAPGETLGLVGESGSGKSTVARAIARIEPITSGEITLNGRDIATGRPDQGLRRSVQMIFQDPRASLNPRHTIEAAVREPLDIHKIGDPRRRTDVVIELLRKVGLDSSHRQRFPHALSGGQLQRVAIARALAVEPELLLCDEPVSSLDVSIQAQVVNLLKRLQAELGVSYLFIAHDLAVVRNLSHRIGVMYLGALVETADSNDLFARPMHPYTKALIDAIPEVETDAGREKIVLSGEVPSPLAVPSGCRFRTRCPWAQARCASERPELRSISSSSTLVACHYAESIESSERAAVLA